MDIKIGNIYKVIQQENAHVGIVIEIGESYNGLPIYNLITTSGGTVKVVSNEHTTFSSARLKPEVRTSLTDLYKQHVEVEKMQQQIKKIEAKLWEKKDVIQKKKEKIKLLSGEFQLSDVAQKFYDIRSWSNDPKNPNFSFYLDKEVAKYPRTEDFPFLYLEYDNSLHMYEDTEYIKKYKLNIQDADIEQLKKKLKHTILKSVSDQWELGDKSLYVNKVFQFSVKKGSNTSTYTSLLQYFPHLSVYVPPSRSLLFTYSV